MARCSSASQTMALALRRRIATTYSSPISRPKRLARAWACSCPTAWCASIKDNFCSRAIAEARYSLWSCRHSAVDTTASHLFDSGQFCKGRSRRLAKPEDVAIRIAEPCPSRRADLGDVTGGLQRALGVVDELDFTLLKFADHRLDIGHLEVGERVVGQARCAAED